VAHGLLGEPAGGATASNLCRGQEELDKEEFLHRVMKLTGLHDKSEAKRATRAALAVLRDALTPEEAYDLGSQLPKEFRNLLWSPKGKWTPPQTLPMESVVNHVRSVLAAENRDRAEEVTRGIFTVLREAVSPGELEDIVSVLPPELRQVLTPS